MAKAKAEKPKEPEPVKPAAYTVVARRYRPQQLADLIGQEHVAAGLTNALTSGRIAHAYLFTGARGVGKTSAARILAKCLNCEKGPTPTPCDVCSICKSITAGDDVDVLEIDGASNNGVDSIRELKSNVGFRPQRSRNKIYIIDEVHMLSPGAFNALLKTLEEPPAHVKFIFATTEVQKLPITILSRCQRFDFATINASRVFATLKHIVAKEGLQADDDALHLIARRAAGSMRDGQTLLDQLLGNAEGKVTVAGVNALLGTSEDDRVADLAEAILTRDPRKAIDQLSTAADRGLQLGVLLDQVIDYWRGLMLVLVAGDDARDLPGTPTLHTHIRKRAAETNLDNVLAGLDVLTTTKSKLRGSPHLQVLFEVAVIRLAKMDELLSVVQLTQRLSSGVLAPATASDSSKKNSLTTVNGSPKVDAPSRLPIPSTTSSLPTDANPLTLPAIWERVRQDVGMMRGAQLQEAGLPAILGPNALAIRFPPGYSSAYDACANETGLEAIRKALLKVTGKDWSVRVEQVVGKAPAPAAKADSRPAPEPATRKSSLMSLPLFQKAAEALGAQLLRADEGFNPNAADAKPTATEADPDEVEP